MSYREHAPHPALRRLVECHWSIRTRIGPERPVTHGVLPDGCIDILFDLAPSVPIPGRHAGAAEAATQRRIGAARAASQRYAGASEASDSTAPSSPWVVGTMTRPLPVHRSGRVDLHGIRFRPGGARAFLDVEAHHLTDRTIALDALWGRASSEIQDRLAATADVGARVSLLDETLLRRLRSDGHLDVAVLAASELAANRRGAVTVDAMAEAAGLGPRQLERRFLDSVGIPPKTACRVARLRAAVSMLHREPETPLARIALEAGYADQPHFTREFRRLTETTPDAYRRARREG